MDAGGGARVRLINSKITSLRDLEAEHGPYSAVIVAAGAANALIEEVSENLLLCVGITIIAYFRESGEMHAKSRADVLGSGRRFDQMPLSRISSDF